MKKNIFLAQANYLHGRATFLPYAAGTLIANAKADPALCDYYEFAEPLFLREDVEAVVAKIDNPCLFGFSNYIWNHEYNRVLAKRIKEKHPDCIIVFGGHHITPDSKLMQTEDYIDIMIFGEGEEIFALLLTALKNGTDLSEVPNIAYRENGRPVESKKAKICGIDYPSPYLTGVFDSIFENYPEYDFHAIFETNRGCPYNCAYCDWGSLHSGVRFFSEEKILAELRWFSAHNISAFGCADANFGMFERDEKFVDEMVRLKKEQGVFSMLQASYAKNSNDRVFSITQKLNDCGMNKGATLSFQSLSEAALANVNRKNISVDTFTSLLNRYNQAGIATYTELILGLPGETYESFVDGIDVLLNSGQHNSIYIHDCEWLPCSTMGSKEYTEHHGIKTVRVPLNQPHRVMEENEIQEYSQLVVATSSMSVEDWVNMNIYSAVIQCFHHEGLLMLFALYLHDTLGVRYSDFYVNFTEFMLASPETVGGRALNALKDRLYAVAAGEAGLVWVDKRFGDVGWPNEEYLFLCCAFEAEKFFEEIRSFLAEMFEDKELFEELFSYQKNTVKLPFKDKIEFQSGYNFKKYFLALLRGEAAELKKENCRFAVQKPVDSKSWPDYARHIVWYGRKDSRNIYVDEIESTVRG